MLIFQERSDGTVGRQAVAEARNFSQTRQEFLASAAASEKKEQVVMARPHVVSNTLPLLTLEPLSPTCLVCGKAAHIAYHTQRTVTTLTGRHRLHLTVRRCAFPACSRYHQPYRSEAEGAWALPHGEYGLVELTQKNVLPKLGN